MKTTIPAEIKTYDQAYAFLKELHNNGEIFHPDDDPSSVGYRNETGDWITLFKPDEAALVNKAMNECFNVNADPSAIAMDIMDRESFFDTLKQCLLFAERQQCFSLIDEIKYCLERLDEERFIKLSEPDEE